jgi:nitrogen regulatory protein P-II 2
MQSRSPRKSQVVFVALWCSPSPNTTSHGGIRKLLYQGLRNSSGISVYLVIRNARGLLRREMDVLMKLVTTIIRPFKLDEVRDALTKIGVQGLTVTEVRGYGRQKGHTEIYRGAEYAERFLPKIKVEIACLSNQVDKVIETIISSAKTGKIGDGKIFVYGIDHAVRIRTGETDTDAI